MNSWCKGAFQERYFVNFKISNFSKITAEVAGGAPLESRILFKIPQKFLNEQQKLTTLFKLEPIDFFTVLR